MKAKRVEEISLNSWPALHQIHYDGWVLRFSQGYTKRANSINILSPGEIEPEIKIHYCEKTYSEQTLPVIFRLNSLTGGTLDALLSDREYGVLDPTSVQSVNLHALSCEMSTGIEVWNDRITDWMKIFAELQGWGTAVNPIHQKMVELILSSKFLLVLRDSQKIVSCGLGVLEDDYIGIFDMVTDAAYRNRGFGKQMVSSLLALGRRHGAEYAYLQVVKKNDPALRLYASFGFEEIYDYWYRIRS